MTRDDEPAHNLEREMRAMRPRVPAPEFMATLDAVMTATPERGLLFTATCYTGLAACALIGCLLYVQDPHPSPGASPAPAVTVAATEAPRMGDSLLALAHPDPAWRQVTR